MTSIDLQQSFNLFQATQHLKLSKKWLANMVDARFEQMEDKSYTSIKHIEEFAEKGVCPMNYLLLQCLGVENIHADHAASHIGKAQSIVTLLRAAPFHAGKKKVYLPMDLLIKNKVSQESVIRGKTDQPIKDVVYETASIAHHHLKHARSFKSDVPKEACVAFLSTVSCEWYLKQLQTADFNIFDSRLQRRNNLLPLRLWLQKRKKTY
ncbi:NADH dehydrogenase (ubiquinone) complex I, assembly factor 6 isoform X2 [Patella vulgata]|uniref:NADH dehydrogenase (ubiquinone) complex I, assembly factor 6 isoform X2 n=1 Tax=Patella vulgata TaxID=6465 RepID=UPI0024A88C3E|nr:NADH dehydrogenase (ubiquinone) complex I, assembly factor 6 isoform X2 [Patella vulgata]